ncbi:hypothetical protein [Tropicibacter naphthalenivorans]|uniref:Alpha/beta hydrolase family protein n=1 Tax=Tropicibacter naphthalenivorans TaxID=441103 RepID=A0A0P1GC72_9RHOB|nr:hypothetical protein [Tropicibacter naphthalenivorans]CUH78931.1 hypothetical protein TRN7648_02242 [Tropicibacter naphthalenivorans]SMD10449.1 hypothetical protein SAMN04488093_12217 [Tropicibacter naphthalenivorans]
MFAKINAHVPKAEEKALGTSGVIGRYHALLNTPFSHPLGHPGYIIGIEKAPRDKAGYRHDTGGTRSFDGTRLTEPIALPRSGAQSDLDQQKAAFRRATNDPKVMLVSHILRYAPIEGGEGLAPDVLHSAYSHSAFGTWDNEPGNAYEAGWQALDRMQGQILDDIAAAKARGHPFTHIAFLAMGWNNDQFEALDRYNAIVHHTRRAAQAQGQRFHPLVIGITWPSVWGGTSVVDLANRALHIGSYPVKADDADEIGYGIANHVMNAILPHIEAQTGLRTIAIGHSMGARMMTRAYYSADLLQARVARKGLGPLVIGLQGAFSANRFREGYRLIAPVRWVTHGEGGPYQDVAAPGGDLVLTWSRKDNANPVAVLLTGAKHVGGRLGAKVMHEKLQRKVHAASWPSDMRAAFAQADGKALYLDVTDSVASHGDIRTPQTGQLVWDMIAARAG